MTTEVRLPALPDAHPVTRWVVFAAFLIMTIGFASYHLLLRLGFISAFLGGYMGLVGAALFIPLMVVYALQVGAQPWRFTRGDVLFFAFMLMISVVAVLNLARGRVVDIAEGHLAAVTQMAVFYVLFHLLDLRWRPFQFAVAGGFVFLAAIMISLGLGGITAEEYREIQFLPSENFANYAHYANLFLFLMVFSVALSPFLILRLAIYGVSAITLFYNGARSELIVALAMFLIAESLLSRKNMALMLGAALVLLLLGGQIVALLETAFPDNRIVQLLSDFSADQSVREREYVLDHALDIIRESPVFGQYGYYMEGLYAHNLVSAWADFGLLGFALFLAGIAMPLAGVMHIVLTRIRIDPELLAFALIAAGSFALFLFAKYYAHPTFSFALALYSRQLARKRCASEPEKQGNLLPAGQPG